MSQTAARFVRLAGPTARAMPMARALSTSAPRPNWATDSVKHGLKSVDRAVSDKIVLPGLNAAEKVKEGAQALAHGKHKHKPEEYEGLSDMAADTAEGFGDAAVDTAEGAADRARGAADRAKGAAQDTADRARSAADRAKGAAQDTADRAKGAAQDAADKARKKM